MVKINTSALRQKMRQAQQRFEQQVRQTQQKITNEINKINRDNKRAIDEYNRKAEAHNRRVIAQYNSQVQSQNRKINSHNQQVIANLNRQLRTADSNLRYTPAEQELADRVHQGVASQDPRDYDTFLSYARIDGSTVASELREELEKLGVAVWFDEIAIVPGKSQSLQMDAGLRKARSGIVLLTPAYLTGRFWTERELGVLLSKQTLIPVLHNVTFEDVREYSGILPDLAGFTTVHDTIPEIAIKIAAAVLVEDCVD